MSLSLLAPLARSSSRGLRSTLTLLALVSGALVSLPVALAQQPKKVTTVEGVTEYQFDNGARLLLVPDPSRPAISVNMTVLVGSRHEGYGEAGMAHLLEHLVFKGTPTHPDVPKALRDHGANFNGTTNSDRTNYFETVPANDENLEFCIRLECDRLVNSFIRREDLISEFTVVRNEFERGENSPESILYQRVQSAAYEWHNYGKSTIGNRSDIERVPIDNLQAFYRKYYQPDNVVLIVAGKFEEPKALELATKYLGSIPKPTRKLDATYTEEPAQDGERIVTLRRVGTVGSVMAAYHMPAASHADWAPLSILGSVLSESKVGILDAKLVETKLATGASASADNSHDPGLFFFTADPAEGNLETVRDKLLEIIDTLGDQPISDEAFERAKTRYKRRSEQTLANAQGMSGALSSASSLGDWRLLFLQRDRIAKVTTADVKRVASIYFAKNNRTLGVFIPADAPQRTPIPTVESIADLVKDYRGGEAVASGEAFDPSPENLDKRTKVIEVGGIRVALLPKKNRGETVAVSLSLRYGNEESLNGKSTAAGMLSGMLMAGTKQLDRQALQARMSEIGVQIFPGVGGGGRRGGGGGGGGRGQLAFSVQGKRESIVAGIELLGQILREPAFAADEFEKMKLRSITGLQSMKTDPAALASDKMGKALSDYPATDVRYVKSNEETLQELEKVTLDDVKELYARQLSSATGEVAIVGDFDVEPTLAAVEKILKDWKSEVSYRSIDRDARKLMQGAKESIVTPDKANAIFMAGMSLSMNEADSESTALEIGNFILGGGTLSSRLGNRIRQKEGLSYGVSSALSTPSRGNDARFMINAITNPDNIDAVERAAMEELKRFIAEGPSQQELDDAKTAFLEALKVSRSSDGTIAGQMISNLHLGRTFAYATLREERVKALTPDDVRKAFEKFIDPAKLVIIRAGDFK